MNNLLTLKGLTEKEIMQLVKTADAVKKDPKKYSKKLDGKTLLLIFEQPSLRTRLSFEAGIRGLGGGCIYYNLRDESVVRTKEPFSDMAKIVSRYVDCMGLRLADHREIEEVAKHSRVPVINALSDAEHPCQILSDLFTIYERQGKFKGLKLAFVGDGNNNITHSLLYGCSKMGIDIFVGCPKKFGPNPKFIRGAKAFAKKSGSKVEIVSSPKVAVENADIVYTDTWMSYHIPKTEQMNRMRTFMKYKVTKTMMRKANPKAVFMHNLPAERGMEVAPNVIDGPESIVIDQAENRMHMAKAILLNMLLGT